MANFQTAIQVLFQHEGGLVTDPNDSGGTTNFGICQRWNPDLDIPNITQAEAETYYFTKWWKEYKLDQINDDDLACYMLDHGVNTGMAAVTCVVQRAIGAVVDGIMGPNTIALINARYFPGMLSVIQTGLWVHYQKIIEDHPGDAKFRDGWYTRCFEL